MFGTTNKDGLVMLMTCRLMKINSKLVVAMIVLGFLIGCSSSLKNKAATPSSLDSKLDELVNQIVTSLSQNQKTKIAVIEFLDIQGNVTNLGRFLAEELTTRLYRTNQFEVVERHLLNKIIQEHQLSLSGIIDENSAVELGKILGVEAIATGSITDLGTSVKVNARLISTESGKVFSVASINILKDDTIKKLLEQKVGSSELVKNEDKTNPVIEESGIRFEATGAKMIDRKAIVQIKITNLTEDDIEFGMMIGFDNKQFTTMIYDDSGNEYIVSGSKLGNKFRSFKNSVTQYDGVGTKIIAGNSVNMELHFDKVSSQATKISLMQINCGRRMGMLEFRDIALEK